jgi:ATP-binding cassette subfamily F protein 3
VLSQESLSIPAGARLGLIGANGAGKSTLIKLLAGVSTPLSGERREGRNLVIGYFAQHQRESLRGEQGALWHLQRLAPNAREQDLRAYLGQFRFGAEMVFQPVDSLSGGEQARLLLALIIWQRPNLLLLDEPTNHLDMQTREALTIALQSFEGAVVLVSHDRHLLRSTAEGLLVISDGRLQAFDGDLDDYRAQVVAQRRAQNRAAPAARAPSAAQRRRPSRKPVIERIERLERELAGLSAEGSRIDARLADPALYAAEGRSELEQMIGRAAQIKADTERLEAEWFECQASLEAAQD